MAEYLMREVTDLNETGKRLVLPFMDRRGMLCTDEIVQRIQQRSTYTRADVLGVLSALEAEMAYGVSSGYSVKLDGLGVFSATLGFRSGAEAVSEADNGQRNAQSIVLKAVKLRVDKRLVEQARMNFVPVRSKRKAQCSSDRYSEAERYDLLMKHLAEHAYIRTQTYAEMTGLLRMAAYRELCRWVADAERKLTTVGRGAHKLYVRLKE